MVGHVVMVTGADSISKEELMDNPSVTHTQNISIIYIHIATDIDQI